MDFGIIRNSDLRTHDFKGRGSDGTAFNGIAGFEETDIAVSGNVGLVIQRNSIHVDLTIAVNFCIDKAVSVDRDTAQFALFNNLCRKTGIAQFDSAVFIVIADKDRTDLLIDQTGSSKFSTVFHHDDCCVFSFFAAFESQNVFNDQFGIFAGNFNTAADIHTGSGQHTGIFDFNIAVKTDIGVFSIGTYTSAVNDQVINLVSVFQRGIAVVFSRVITADPDILNSRFGIFQSQGCSIALFCRFIQSGRTVAHAVSSTDDDIFSFDDHISNGSFAVTDLQSTISDIHDFFNQIQSGIITGIIRNSQFAKFGVNTNFNDVFTFDTPNAAHVCDDLFFDLISIDEFSKTGNILQGDVITDSAKNTTGSYNIKTFAVNVDIGFNVGKGSFSVQAVTHDTADVSLSRVNRAVCLIDINGDTGQNNITLSGNGTDAFQTGHSNNTGHSNILNSS